MQIRRRERVLGASIPTATMADIAFLLIVFFMVTTAYSVDRTPMRLPETREQQQVAKGAAVIAIAPDGGLRFSPGDRDSRPVASLERLAVELRRMTAANLLHPFVIKADREVAYRAIDEVLEQLRLAGAQDVALLSRGERRP